MLRILLNRTFRHLFAAQLVALIGTGLATVALGLLAWQMAGADAGQVLGTALAIKMLAYVTLAPVAAAIAARLPRRAFLVGLDVIRAGVVLILPFVTEVWQIYLLIFLLQAASAGFTPAFQATIPDVLPDTDDYTNALSLLRLTEDFEQLVSPILAASLLLVVSFPVLFAGTVLGYLASALLVVTVALPARSPAPAERFWTDATKGIRIIAATPRLRGAVGLELAVAAAGAGVMVASVAMVPLVAGLAGVMGLWAIAGFGFACTQTPIGRILTRSAAAPDRPAVFAAQFALSHACWLLTYPLAGWLGAGFGLAQTALVLAGLGAVALGVVAWVWPAHDPDMLTHDHPGLPPDHPHLRGQGAHRHAVTIDALHPRWPRAV